MSRTPRIVCLLPARNAADDLPRWLEEAPAFCDAVVALDDGSTDETGALLAAHPLVERLLTNPRRDTYLGWHDGENRNRLLAAAGELQPDWILYLDADERIDPSDAAALRSFLASDALTACVYGFEVFQMLEDETHDPVYEVDWRLFAYRPGERVPNRRLDFPPVPPPGAAELWVRTTLRIQHYGEVGETGRAQRLAKYREADPTREFASWWDNLPELSPGPHPRWQPRRLDEPVLDRWIRIDPSRRAPRPMLPKGARLAGAAPSRPTVVCLLPTRNCAADLPGYFASVAPFADVVVALDDGSTDGTAAVLADEPLVKVLLRNPRREGYAGWDDSANRNRLLDAAADLHPDWIVSVDSDERLAPDDAAALRRFIDEEALAGFAYGFEIHRMIGDLDHFDRVEFVAYRMFSYADGQTLPADRLHFVPVPSSIPEARWLETTIRVQHLAALDEDRRRQRWSKYREADPDHEWEPDYEYTRAAPGKVRRWRPRPRGLAVLVAPDDEARRWELEAGQLDLEGPVLSVVVVGADAEAADVADLVTDVVATVGGQADLDIVELILVVRQGCRALAALTTRHPDVAVVELPGQPSAAEAANAGLRLARGDHVTFLTPTARLADGAVAAILGTHEEGHGILAAPVARPSGATPAAAAHRALDAAPVVVADGDQPVAVVPFSFPREALLAVGGLPDVAGWATVMAEHLEGLGLSAMCITAVSFVEAGGELSVSRFLVSRFQRGRAQARLAGGRGLVRLVPPELARLSSLVVGGAGRSSSAAAALAFAGLLSTWAGISVQGAEQLARRVAGTVRLPMLSSG